MWAKKVLVLLLCCLLLVSSPCICLAADYRITGQELARLETIFNQLEINNSKLLSDLEQSKLDLKTARLNLEESQKKLVILQENLNQLKNESNTAMTSLMTANNLLQKANESLKQSVKEQNRLRFERDIAILGFIVLAIRR